MADFDFDKLYENLHGKSGDSTDIPVGKDVSSETESTPTDAAQDGANKPADEWSLEALNLVNDADSRDIYSTTDQNKPSDEKKKKQKDVKLAAGGKVKKKKKRSPVARAISTTLISILLVCIIAGSVFFLGVMLYVFNNPIEAPDLDNLKLHYTTVVYAEDGDTGEYYELSNFHGTQNRIWVDYVDISSYLPDAIVSIEDKRFWDHEGVDWRRTIGAVINELTNIWGSSQGGSSITQQLVKNLTGDDERTAMRKINEIARATKIERRFHKNTIIECYINTVHFGNGCDGIQTAAEFYFGKDAKDLTLLESAALAATIRTPARENPLDGPEANKERRELCLKLMLNEGYITEEEYKAALAETLTVVANEQEEHSYVYTWFEEALLDQVQNDLMEQKDMTAEEASDLIFSGGLRIYSTYNNKVQKHLDDVFADDDYFVKDKDGEYPQAAQVIMDYQGHIVAMSGGRGEKTANRGLNRATDAKRQPGSSIKPLAVYSPAIEYNMLTYSSHIYDFHIKLANGGYYPKAAGSGAYVTTLKAIQSSLNSTSVRVANELSPEKCFDFLTKKYKLSTLVSKRETDGDVLSDKTLSAMALGGMVDGVTVAEMTAAYATFGNLGVYWKPTTYTVVYDVNGDVVLEQEAQGEQVLTPETANIMCELLQNVTRSGTASAAHFGSWPLMGKTGTTDNKHDCWLGGGSPYYASVLWIGYDQGKDLPGGANPTNRVYKAVMERVHKDLELCDFNEVDDVVYNKYCTDTGMIATDTCVNTSWGYYKKNYQPVCNAHAGTPSPSTSKPSLAGGKAIIYDMNVKPDPDDAINSIKKQKEAASK